MHSAQIGTSHGRTSMWTTLLATSGDQTFKFARLNRQHPHIEGNGAGRDTGERDHAGDTKSTRPQAFGALVEQVERPQHIDLEQQQCGRIHTGQKSTSCASKSILGGSAQNLQPHIRMTGLIQRTPAGKVAALDLHFCGRDQLGMLFEVLTEKPNVLTSGAHVAIGVLPTSGVRDRHGARRQAPALLALQTNSFRRQGDV